MKRYRRKWSVQYNRGDGIIEIIISDPSGKKIDKFTANQKDTRIHSIIGRTLKEKYGIDFTPMIDSDFIKEEKGFFDY